MTPTAAKAERRAIQRAMAAWPTVYVEPDYADDEVWWHENVTPSERGAALVRMRNQRDQREAAGRTFYGYLATRRREAFLDAAEPDEVLIPLPVAWSHFSHSAAEALAVPLATCPLVSPTTMNAPPAPSAPTTPGATA